MTEKPYRTDIVKSKGKAIYARVRIWEHKDGIIHVSSDFGHTFCQRGSSIEKFFRGLLDRSKGQI